MIMHANSGAVIVVNECHWTPGAWVAVNQGSGCGTVVAHGPGGASELDQLIDELTKIRAAIDAREQANQQRSAS